jgi:hypothetical protein
MRPDASTPLATAARQRHELTRSKTIQALRELDRAGTAVTFESVARHADVSRSWLYSQPDIRTEIERLRRATRRSPSSLIPAAQHTSDASLLCDFQSYLARNLQRYVASTTAARCLRRHRCHRRLARLVAGVREVGGLLKTWLVVSVSAVQRPDQPYRNDVINTPPGCCTWPRLATVPQRDTRQRSSGTSPSVSNHERRTPLTAEDSAPDSSESHNRAPALAPRCAPAGKDPVADVV